MKAALAERLLVQVMGWDAETVATERPVLQHMAAYKYDQYQRFSPGKRFLESLALWLQDLKDPQYQELAYKFVRERLIFFSAGEMQHFVQIAFPDFIQPMLLRKTADISGINRYHVGRIAKTTEFRKQLRSCLYLGLSDGARTDLFRRSNGESVSHEQVLQSYEISSGRVGKLLEELKGDLETIDKNSVEESPKFKTIVLLDDFSASGTSYLRKDSEKLKGKLKQFTEEILTFGHEGQELIDVNDARVILLLYIATEQAQQYLANILGELWGAKGIAYDLVVVHPLDNSIKIEAGDDLDVVLDEFYDENAEDEHTRQGGSGVKYGYASCGMPIVLSHNTPNNSIFPLWSDMPRLRPLFPRISRHREL